MFLVSSRRTISGAPSRSLTRDPDQKQNQEATPDLSGKVSGDVLLTDERALAKNK